MCRLYGFRATEPTKVECSLIYAQNALMVQSRGDQHGRSHADGWGVGYFEDHHPRVHKAASAAYEALEFQNSAARAWSTTVVAHVRRATVGSVSVENAHPFRHGCWLFAHNGTVAPFELLADRLRQESGEFGARCQGSTDSETAFHWLLARLAKAGIGHCQQALDPEHLADTFRRAVADLAERCEQAAPGKARLNMLLTDGRTMVASRHRNDLFRLERVGVHDCEICGIPHIQHDPSRTYLAAVVASEPITSEDWYEVPDHSVVRVTPDLEQDVRPL